MTTSTFNTGVARHAHTHTDCKICGIKSLYLPRSLPDGYVVNVRYTDSGTIDSIEIEAVNSREWKLSMPKPAKRISKKRSGSNSEIRYLFRQ